jgi:dihydrofolate reductase
VQVLQLYKIKAGVYKMLSFVVAVSENNVIGKNGNLPWRLPEDLKFFKDITSTSAKTMIMGRKTFESLPKVLPGRKHIILTRNKDFKVHHEEVDVVYDIESLKPYIEATEEYFVIGGAEIFKQLLPYTDRIYLTRIHEKFQGDTFFPEFNKEQWKATLLYEGIVDEENLYPRTYLKLDRIKK